MSEAAQDQDGRRVAELAVDEPQYSEVYARMCQVLSGINVPVERKSPEDPEFVNFRKLIVNRCQHKFEKNTEAELIKEAKLQEIKAQTDPERKKELTLIYEEEERRVQIKSLGNIRFIGELFKLKMLTTSIMHRCIRHLLSQGDEESLECLCILLTIIGKYLESKTGPGGNQNDLAPYFISMKRTANKRGQNSISSRVRFMLQDVIELRLGKWIPRRDRANPKTMDQIRDERVRDFCRQQDGWQSVPARTNRNLVVDTSKIKVKQGEIENVSLGAGTQFSKWSRGAGGVTRVEEKKAAQPSYGNMYSVLGDTANVNEEKRGPPMPSQRPGPGKSTPSPSMEKERMLAAFGTPGDVSSRSSRSLSVEQSSRSSSLDNSVRRNDFDSQPGSVIASNEDVHRAYLDKNTSNASKATELNFEDIIKKSQLPIAELLSNNLFANLEYTVGAMSVSLHTSASPSLTMDQIQQKLVSFLKPEQGSNSSSFDHVCDWISANVGDLVKDSEFIRALMTSICESAICDSRSSTWKLRQNVFQQHQKLLLKYVDNDADRELQCLYAIQSFDHGLDHPQGLLWSIFQELYDSSVFSSASFLAWESSMDPAEQSGKGVALKSLAGFFTCIKEVVSSCDKSC